MQLNQELRRAVDSSWNVRSRNIKVPTLGQFGTSGIFRERGLELASSQVSWIPDKNSVGVIEIAPSRSLWWFKPALLNWPAWRC